MCIENSKQASRSKQRTQALPPCLCVSCFFQTLLNIELTTYLWTTTTTSSVCHSDTFLRWKTGKYFWSWWLSVFFDTNDVFHSSETRLIFCVYVFVLVTLLLVQWDNNWSRVGGRQPFCCTISQTKSSPLFTQCPFARSMFWPLCLFGTGMVNANVRLSRLW